MVVEYYSGGDNRLLTSRLRWWGFLINCRKVYHLINILKVFYISRIDYKSVLDSHVNWKYILYKTYINMFTNKYLKILMLPKKTANLDYSTVQLYLYKTCINKTLSASTTYLQYKNFQIIKVYILKH